MLVNTAGCILIITTLRAYSNSPLMQDCLDAVKRLHRVLRENHLQQAVQIISCVSDNDIYTSMLRWLLDRFIPDMLVVLPALAAGCGAGAMVGSVLGVLLTLQGIYSMWSTYGDLYNFFWQHGTATLRFAIRRSDSLRIFSCVVANAIIGMLVVVMLSFCIGGMVALLLLDWSGGEWFRQAFSNTVANVLTYLWFVELIVAPICIHFQLGPALFAMEVYSLQISLLRGWMRMVYVVLFMLKSYFNPAACALPENVEGAPQRQDTPKGLGKVPFLEAPDLPCALCVLAQSGSRGTSLSQRLLRSVCKRIGG